MDNNFCRHIEVVNHKIMTVYADTLNAGIGLELAATIRAQLHILGEKYSSEQLELYVIIFLENSEDIPDEICTVEIALSYDMGWKQRGTWHIYNSLSEYGFNIGCITGNVISMCVKAKTCQKCQRANNTSSFVPSH